MFDMSRDRGLGQFLDEGALPVGPDPLGIEAVERTVQRGIRQRARPVGYDRGDVHERLEDLLGLVERARPMHHGEREGVPVPVLGDERQRRGDLKPWEAAELLGRIPYEFVEHTEQRRGVLEVVEDRSRKHLADLVQAEFEGRHHAEVAAPAPKSPKEVLVLTLAGGDESPIRCDNVG